MFGETETAAAFFRRATARPRLTLTLCLVAIGGGGAGLTTLVKDTSLKAFIPPDHPAVVADERARSTFGLADTIAVAITPESGTVFDPAVFGVIADLTSAVSELPNIRADRVMSLATESSIDGDGGSIDVVPYIDERPATAESAEASRLRWLAMPPHQGTLVSDDGGSAIVLADIVDTDRADATYAAVRALTDAVDVPGLRFDVAGPAAVSGYLSRYIDADARRLQPLVFLLVFGFIFLAFRKLAALPGPLLVVVGAAGGALGIMALSGVPYYAITNALPVVIVAISVADAIHVLSAYFENRSKYPHVEPRELTIQAMVAMARPITLTTLTTMAGFFGIAAVSVMPPIAAFAWYAALGVALAWVFSIIALPNMLVLLKLSPSPAFENWRHNRPSGLGKALAHAGAIAAARYPVVLAVSLAALAVAAYGTSLLRIDRSQVDSFPATEPVRLADEYINATFAGTDFLDVVVETPDAGGLLDAGRMRRIVELQTFAESLPHVTKTIGITDYIGLLHRAVRGGGAARDMPDLDDAIAQYLLLYEVSGDPADFEEEIDYDYRTALVRVVLDSHYYSESRETVEALQAWLDASFNSADLQATLAGDTTVSYHWMRQLEKSHFLGVGLSLLLVLLTSVAFFRSLTAGLIAVVPVSSAVVTLYAAMGYLGIYLEPATSMFAAIALGVGVDFGIHLVERLRRAQAIHDDPAAAVDHALPATARACFFNSAALALGFAVLLSSSLPTLQRFGGLVALAAVSSYLAALILVPALFAADDAVRRRIRLFTRRFAANGVGIVVVIPALLLAAPERAGAANAADIAQSVYDRAEGNATYRDLAITLTDRRGRQKSRRALVVRENRADARYTRITYTHPKAIRDTAFLSHDYHDPERDDSRWFYTPAMRKDRRVPASDRGDYFLGTDFTYEDIQSELKFDTNDYRFEYLGESPHGARRLPVLGGQPASAAIARETGYGSFVAIVDPVAWMPVQIEFFDLKERPLKTVVVSSIERVDGIWVAKRIAAHNHRTGHRTVFEILDVGFPDDIDDALFTAHALTRGLAAPFGSPGE